MVIINKETGEKLKRGEIPENPIPTNKFALLFGEEHHSPQFRWKPHLLMYLRDCLEKDKFEFSLSDVKEYFIQKGLNPDCTLPCDKRYKAKLDLTEFNNRIRHELQNIEKVSNLRNSSIKLQSNGAIWNIVLHNLV